jgi:DNA/RNA-binding domain of Phe-tRNA-synthetase-like protein
VHDIQEDNILNDDGVVVDDDDNDVVCHRWRHRRSYGIATSNNESHQQIDNESIANINVFINAIAP